MDYSLAEIARATGLVVVGDDTVRVRRPSEPVGAAADELALAMSLEFAESLKDSAAVAAVIPADADWQGLGLAGALIAPRPRVALARLTQAFAHAPGIAPGIHPSAVIDRSAEIGEDAAIGPFAVIGERARIGPGALIGCHVTVGADAVLGARAHLHDGVRIGARCRIGDDFVAHPNAVVGADGFSFEPPEPGNIEAARRTGAVAARGTGGDADGDPGRGFLRIHSLAAVEIGDDVEIGAATTIDRGTIQPTRIGSGTKIDNQVQVGHNVQIGTTCLLCAQVGIAGSARVGDRVVMGGKCGVGDHVSIGSDVVCAAATMLGVNVRPQSVMMGMPAVTRDKALAQFMAIRRLPRLQRQVAEICRKLGL